LSGRRFGRLTALRYSHSDDDGRALWLCRCDCGEPATVRGKDLGKQTSCGCQKREHVRALKFKHGQRWTALYTCWLNMNDRCRNPKNRQYKDYGGRRIKVCGEWEPSFSAFSAYILAHLGERPPGMTLDRIDNDGNYEPGNVRWATRSMQRRNQRRMILNGDSTEAETKARARARA
jgi:hypothetical protein